MYSVDQTQKRKESVSLSMKISQTEMQREKKKKKKTLSTKNRGIPRDIETNNLAKAKAGIFQTVSN